MEHNWRLQTHITTWIGETAKQQNGSLLTSQDDLIPRRASGEPNQYTQCSERRTGWGSIPSQFKSIRPALLLASSFLDEPLMLPFFEGIMNRAAMTILIDPEAKATTLLNTNEDLRKFELADLPDAAAQLVVWEKIRRMHLYVKFAFGGNANGFADTAPSPNYPGFNLNCRGCDVLIDDRFLTILSSRTNADFIGQHYMAWAPGSDAASVKVRTILFLAVTLVHEMCHVMYTRNYPVDPNGTAPRLTEPFYGDQRLAELGNAWESHVFCGSIEPLGAGTEPSLPFGLVCASWPGLGRHSAQHYHPERNSPAKYGVEGASHFAIPNRYVQRYFTERFWDVLVPRFGMRVFRPRKTAGFREFNTQGYDADEAPPPWEHHEIPDLSDDSEDGANNDRFVRPDGKIECVPEHDDISESDEEPDLSFVRRVANPLRREYNLRPRPGPDGFG